MGSSPWLRRSIKKHGIDCFRKEWLTFCEDEEEMNYMEQVLVDQTWVDRSDTYNLELGGKGGWNYVNSLPISEETRRKMSINTTRRNIGHVVSAETRAKIGAANRGKCRSAEALAKMSEAQKGKKLSEETRKKISEAHKGKHHSLEARAKMRAARKGTHLSEETRAKLRAANSGANNAFFGKRHSPEARAKMRAAQRARFARESTHTTVETKKR